MVVIVIIVAIISAIIVTILAAIFAVDGNDYLLSNAIFKPGNSYDSYSKKISG